MTQGEARRTVRVVCDECRFEEEVESGERKPADVILEHGRETGHKLQTEPVQPAD